MNKALLILINLIATFNMVDLKASEQVLAKISNDENKEIYLFVADVNESTDEISLFYKDDFLEGKKTERESLDSKELGHSNGLVLEERSGHIVISLKSHNFDKSRGGIIEVDTLYNGINGERKRYQLHLAKDSTGWKLFNDQHPISKLHIEVNKKAFLGSVGVKNIRME